MDWRKSSHSGANGGSCVEVAGTAQVVLVRDTKDRDSRMLAFTAEAWRAFAEGLKRRLAATCIGSATADQIIDRICRYCSRISGPGH